MRWVLLSALVISLSARSEGGADLLKAPPSFNYQTKKVIPVDFQFMELDYEFDVNSRTAKGIARIEFFSNDEGYPMLDLVPSATKVRLNGVDLGSSGLPLISSPGNTEQFRMVNSSVEAFTNNFLEIEFNLPSSTAAFSSSGVRLVWSMGDVGSARKFLEQYAPANLEFDQFELRIGVELKGATTKHQVYTNGEITSESSSHWNILFPSYFTTSSFYFHITDKNLATLREDYKGIAATIPITVYSESSSTTSSGMAKTKQILAELESTYGPFAHPRVVAYITSSGGGMEHCGATITSLGALGHELTHSYFARGVMPANGNSGWIDEAVASWRDNGYPSSSMGLTGSPVNLAAFDDYHRTTPQAAYSSGARLLSAFSSMFTGGLKPVLREIFSRKKNQTITTNHFQGLMEEISGKDLAGYFQRYVYNKGKRQSDIFPSSLTLPEVYYLSLHPSPLTPDEIAAIR